MENQNQKWEKLDKEDIAHLAKFFDLLAQIDERNKREGRYEKNSE